MVLTNKAKQPKPSETKKKPYRAPSVQTDVVAAPNLYCASGYVDCGFGCVPQSECA